MVLSLAQVVAEKTNVLHLLEEAYDAQLGTGGDRAVVLDLLLEATRAHGFYGSLELAAGVLRASGRFHLRKGPQGEWQVARESTASVLVVLGSTSTALIPFPGPASRALVPFTVAGQRGLGAVSHRRAAA